MNDKHLTKVYSPSDVETRWYHTWEQRGLFHAHVRHDRTPFTIVIPPPNVTGVLHMGHILNNTIQDVLIRFHRMLRWEACWIPGTDHAGIATQAVVERNLAKEKKTRHDLGREKFIERVWEWKNQSGGIIVQQLRLLGSSCDWQREKFTMDTPLSDAVREAFVRLYEDGLIYRGKYIVNWCPKDHTAISDDEVTHTEQHGTLYHIKYPLAHSGFAVVATTRPETMLGDVAIAVHPEDERYKSMIGTHVTLPLVGRNIPIVADEFVDPKFGTGMVKVTPAHDPNDFHIGQRHALPQINIFNPSARLNENVPEQYRELDRFDARKQVVQDLETAGLLEKTEPHTHSVGRCYRCDTIIEPYLSDQWFVRMKPLAEPALEVVRKGLIAFHPDRWARVYEHWMSNIRDWCISRQLWWGHRIPVWYCIGDDHCLLECKQPIVSRTQPAECPHCGSKKLRQDEDVLDTWFSSWLWPFSVHNWPHQEKYGTAKDLQYFYPTSTLVTGPDIIFFWVARMVMSGLKFGPDFTGSSRPEDNIPFRHVYMTSIVRDEKGRKMSKSLGNSPEPVDLIREFGADAVRFTILFLAPLGQDIHYSREKNELGRNFANKIWNAGRFLLMNHAQLSSVPFKPDAHIDLAEKWIVSRFHSTTREVLAAVEQFELNKAARLVYEFVWHDYCDWYVEMMKSRLYGTEDDDAKVAVINRAMDVYDGALRLLHPFMPFITEELWQHIRPRREDESIVQAPLDVANEQLIDVHVEEEMGFVQSVIEAVRNIRGEMSISPSKAISLVFKLSTRSAESISRYDGYLSRLAKVHSISFITNGARPGAAASAVVRGEELFIPLEGVIDIDLEKARLMKEIERIRAQVHSVRNKLGNRGFLAKAPAEVVDKEKEKLENFTLTLEKLEKNYESLVSS